MSSDFRSNLNELKELPSLTFRHLEVFHAINREKSYSNAALELRSNRTNIKKVCESLEKEMGHKLFTEQGDKTVIPTSFGVSLLSKIGPLSRSLTHLGEGIRALHRNGRILRFAASGEYFRGGAFAYILTRIDIKNQFRPCYLRIEPQKFKAALLSSECDVYFGGGLDISSRLEIIHLENIPWSFHISENYKKNKPQHPKDLIPGKWLIEPIGEPEASATLLQQLHDAGAKDGRIKDKKAPADDEILLRPEASWMGLVATNSDWPTYMFSAALKKQHPYNELIECLNTASSV